MGLIGKLHWRNRNTIEADSSYYSNLCFVRMQSELKLYNFLSDWLLLLSEEISLLFLSD